MKNFFRFLLGIVIGIILLYLVFREVDLNLLLKSLSQTKFSYIVYVIILYIILLILRSYRWRMFIKEYKNFKLLKFFESTCVGLFFNNILPFRLGDLVQAYLISKKTNLAKSLTFSSVIMERFIDLIPPIFFIFIGSFFIILPKSFNLFYIFLFILILTFFIFLIFRFKNLIIKKFEILSLKYKIFLKLLNLIKNFYIATSNFKDISMLLKIIFLTFFLWSGYSIGMVLICNSLDIKLPSMWAGFLIQAITSLGVIIVFSPGYIGSWEFMGSLALKIFKVDDTKALAFALLSHILGFFVIFILGFFFFIKEINILKIIKEKNFYEN